jgi:preprotein translocase subunit YajC
MGIVFLLLVFGAMWLLMIRPQQQRLRAQRELVASLQVGDRVVTAGGIVGIITDLDDEDARIEVSPGVVMTFVRPAVSRRLNEVHDVDDIDGSGSGSGIAGELDEGTE